MKRFIVLGAIWATLAINHSVSAQFIKPRQGGDVIGNSTKGASAHQPVVVSAVEKTVVKNPAEQTSEFVTVIGQVFRPGVYEYRNGIASLGELIDEAGGLTRYSSHEIYVHRSGKGYLKLDPSIQRSFQFEDGDILIAETPVRYYQDLNNPDSKVGLYDLHPQTQIVLQNLAAHPILLTVQPKGARMKSLMELLNQPNSAMIGADRIPPPHSSEIPRHSQLAPSLIPSGSIIVLDPQRIDRDSLPVLPASIVSNPKRDIRVVSQESPLSHSNSRELQQSSLYEWKKNSRDTSLSAFETSHAASKSPLDNGQELDLPSEMTASNEPQREADREIVIASRPAKSKLTDQPVEREMILSPQQKAIVIGFLMVIGLFVIAYLVRKKQERRELLPLAADTVKHTNSIFDLYSKLVQRFSGQTSDRSEIEKLETAAETAESFAEAAVCVAELVHETSEEDTLEAEPLAEEVDCKDAVEKINPEVEHRLTQFVDRIIPSATRAVATPIDVSNAEDKTIEPTPAEETADNVPEQITEAGSRSIDHTPIEHPVQSQPMFPMIWEQKLEQTQASATSTPSEVRESEIERVEEESQPTAQNAHPLTNAPHRIPLDRVFFAMQRDRNQDSNPQPPTPDSESP